MNAGRLFAAVMIAGSSFACFPTSRAEELSILPLKATLTKSTPSFQVKNLFSFQLPANLPAPANFRGLIGTLSTTTSPDKTTHKPVWSETLFGLAYTTRSVCPLSGQKIGSYSEIFSSFPSQGLAGLIVKQSGPGTVTIPVAIKLPAGLPMRLPPGGCLFMSFDGTDFANRPYTMTSNLSLLYDTQPSKWPSYSVNGLDAEFVVTPSTARGPVLNAYTVLPVSEKGPLHPGLLLDVYGNVSATSSSGFSGAPVKSGRWSIREIVSVYRRGSCNQAFPHHSENKFMWNDHSGNGTEPNPSHALKPTAQKILDIVLDGNGIDSVMKQANGIQTLPVSLGTGDCVVSAILPNTVDKSIDGSVNVETQIKTVSTP
ncbi:MAG: hypothetical protein ABF542_02745 [Gluconobacter sp.]